MDKKFALMASFCFILVVGNLIYLPQIVSEIKKSQDQYIELSKDYQKLQEAYDLHLEGSGPRYTGNPFSTQLWPGQLQSENITGMHWYSLYNGVLVNCTDNVLGFGGVGEGDYTTWTKVWIRDYSAGPTLDFDGLHVSNIGTVYATDSAREIVHIRTYAGVEDNREDYDFGMLFNPRWHASSVGNRYLVAQNSAAYNTTVDVWKDGTIVWIRNFKLDDPDDFVMGGAYPGMVGISPNGKYLVIAAVSSVSPYDNEVLILYEGS